MVILSLEGLGCQNSVECNQEATSLTPDDCRSEACGNAPACRDTQSPAVEINAKSSVAGADWVLRGKATDAGVLYRVEYVVDGGEPTTLSVDESGRFEQTVELSAGEHAVQVRAHDVAGNTGTAKHVVRAGAVLALTADFSFSGMREVNAPLTFDASASAIPAGAEVASYQWSFGDGDWAAGATTTHLFDAPGAYIVELRVRLQDGREDVHIDNLEIGAPPAVGDAHTFTGVVSDNNGQPLPGVEVTGAAGALAQTNALGEYELRMVPPDDTVALTAAAAGYVPQTRRIGIADAAAWSLVSFQMQPRAAVASGASGTSGADGSSTAYEAGAFENADGDRVEGDIETRITLVDPATHPGRVPGADEGVLSDGTREQLAFSTAAHVAFYKDGEPLRIVPGSQVQVTIPLYLPMAEVGATLGRFAFDAANGLWIERADAPVSAQSESPTGRAAKFEVTRPGWLALARPVAQRELALSCGFSGGTEQSETAELCVVNVSADGWYRTVQLERDAQQTVRAPEGELCFSAVARTGICSTDVCMSESELSSGLVDLELSCLDDDATTLSYGVALSSETLAPGAPHLYSFSGEVGDGVLVTLDSSNTRYDGTLELLSTRGYVLAQTPTPVEGAIGYVLPKTGRYFLRVTNTTEDAEDVKLSVENLPVLSVNETLSGESHPDAETRVLVDAGSARRLNAVALSDYKPRMSFANFLGEAYGGDRGNQEVYEGQTGVTELPDQRYHLLVWNSFSLWRSETYRVTLAAVGPPQALTFDALGRAATTASLDAAGEHAIYTVSLQEGDGLHVRLRRGSEDPVQALQRASFRVSRVGSGKPWAGEEVYYDVARDPGVYDALDAFQLRAPAAGTYAIEVFNYDYTTSRAELGQFALSLERAVSAAEITVDDDGTCPDATTTSVLAATRAVSDSGTVKVCEGTYPLSLPVQLDATGVTLQGPSGENRATIEYTHPYHRDDGRTAIQMNAVGLTLKDLTLTYLLPRYWKHGGRALIGDTPSAFSPRPPDGLTLRNLELDVERHSKYVSNGISLRATPVSSSVGAAEILIEDLELSGMRRGIRLRDSDAVTIRSLSMSVQEPFDLREVGRVVLEDNSLVAQESCIWLDQGQHATGETVIQNNTCSVADNATPIRVATPSEGGSEERSIRVVDNVVDWQFSYPGADAIQCRLSDGETELTVARNDLQMAGNAGIDVYLAPPSGTRQTAPVRIRNNVIRDIRDRSYGVRLDGVELFDDVTIVNNTMRLRPSTKPYSWEHPGAVGLETRDYSFSGAVQVTLANNLVTTTDAGTPVDYGVESVDGQLEIVSKSNLFYGVDTVYHSVTASAPGDIVGSAPQTRGPLLELDATSPAVDAGDCGLAPASDFGGVSRPQGSGCDIGAHER